jgi:hypothetical protein
MSDPIMDRMELKQDAYAAFSAAAASLLSVTVPTGERWRIVHGLASHDDPAAHDIRFIVTRDTVSYILHEVVNVATSIRAQLYTSVVTRDTLILKAGDQIHVESTVAMAAGKKLYIQLLLEKRIGETA